MRNVDREEIKDEWRLLYMIELVVEIFYEFLIKLFLFVNLYEFGNIRYKNIKGI